MPLEFDLATILPSALVLMGIAAPAGAQLTLTQYAIDHQFTLDPFVSNVPSVSNVGPLGFALRTDGQVLVTTATGEIRLFPSHANLQNWNDGILVSLRGQSNAQSIAQIQVNNEWRYYLTQDTLGKIVEIDENGADVVPAHVLSLTGALCLVAYPPGIVNGFTGHLFATAEGPTSIFEIDPSANTVTPFISNAGAGLDGLCFSPDGSTVYVAAYTSQRVKGFDMTTKVEVFTSPPVLQPDGIAIGTGILTGYLYANCGNGQVWEFGLPGTPHAGEANLIASGGSRGDFIASDPNVFCGSAGHPSLLLTQSTTMLRLDPPGGGFFGPPTSSVELVNCGTLAGSASSYAGDGVNEDLLAASAVVIGSPWSASITSVNAHGPGGPVVLTVRASLINGPTFASPLGGRQNEFLIAGPVLGKYTGSHNGFTGSVITPSVPVSCSLVGRPWAAQATLVGGGFGDLTNALSGVIGTF